MRVLHVTTYLQGGAGRVIADLAIEQRRAGYDVIVVEDSASHAGYASYPEYLEALGRAGVELHRVRSTFTRDVPLNVDAAGDLSRLIGNRHVNVIHAHAAIPAMVARLALGSRATPIIVTVHGWGLMKTVDQTRTDVTLLRLVDAVVAPSAALRDRLQGLGVADLVRVVPYGIELASSRAIDGRDDELVASIRSRRHRIAVCIGSVGERKNQGLLVRALARSGCEDLHVMFIGEGETAALQAAADDCGVAPRVHVLGYRTDASRYLQHADVLVLPSRDEGLPLVVLEALRDGVPVVASDIPEILEALGGGRLGCVFSCGSAASLADALSRTLSLEHDARSSLAAAQRTQWEQRHRLGRMVDAYDGLYKAHVFARGEAGFLPPRLNDSHMSRRSA